MHIIAALDNMSGNSAMGFAFDLLIFCVKWSDEEPYYSDPLLFFDLRKQRNGKHVTLLHDYPLWKWTITARK